MEPPAFLGSNQPKGMDDLGHGALAEHLIGVDEAGRGALAGPVVAAAVVLNPGAPITGLNDSKQLSPQRRQELALEIRDRALAWLVAESSVTEIDEINILQATFLAMHRCISGLLQQLPQRAFKLLIDGNRFKTYPGLEHQCIIGGDGIHPCIMAASILAKVHRDQLMEQLHPEFPEYGWVQNKGYGTIAHRKAIINSGRSPHHRTSFRLKEEQLMLAF